MWGERNWDACSLPWVSWCEAVRVNLKSQWKPQDDRRFKKAEVTKWSLTKGGTMCVLQMAETENQGFPTSLLLRWCLCVSWRQDMDWAAGFCVCPAEFPYCFGPVLVFQERTLASCRCVLEVYNLMVDVTVTQSWEYALRWEGIWIHTFKQCWESLDSEPLHIELNAFDIMRWPWTFGNVLWVCRVAQRLMCLTILFPACGTVLVGTLFPNLSSCITYNFA